MVREDPARADRLAELEAILGELIAVAQRATSPTLLVDGEWTVHDVVAHIGFWQASFARNVDDLAAGRRPRPLRGRLADLNQRGVAEARPLPFDRVVADLRASQAVIRRRILEPSLGPIPYRVGSRAYLPDEHLDTVRDHVRGHLRVLERALDGAARLEVDADRRPRHGVEPQ